jgi:hypothetical protein
MDSFVGTFFIRCERSRKETGADMVLNPEERKILLIEINGRKIDPEEVKEINVPEKNDFVWEFTFKDDSTINATGNITVKYL